jgi:hypothetical protein
MTMLHDWLIQAAATAMLVVALLVIGVLAAWFAWPAPAQPKDVCEQHLYHMERREL